MKITAISLENVRGFRQLPEIDLSRKINVLIGPNNAGKSTILHAVFRLQNQNILNQTDVTINERTGKIRFRCEGTHQRFNNRITFPIEIMEMQLDSSQIRILNRNRTKEVAVESFSNSEPHHLIYPYLAKRKTSGFSNDISSQVVDIVSGNLQYLYAKIDQLNTPQFEPAHSQYKKACLEILGFEIGTLAKQDGKEAVYFIRNQFHIPLSQMGEGVSNILGLVTYLCLAENKIFVIEEPENDIHPKALKGLLNLIVERSVNNQFFISTHSHIVMKHLGADPSTKILKVNSDRSDPNMPNLYLSKVTDIPKSPHARREVLEELGYEFHDFDLWSAWLFLEESSAEEVIREYLIPWFVPNLKGRLRTFSGNGKDGLKQKFGDFNRLFVFLHLEPAYKNKVWVKIDAGLDEARIISDFKDIYSQSGWDENQFAQWSEHEFEKYYPLHFQAEIGKITQASSEEKRSLKQQLLTDLKAWIKNDEALAKSQFRSSAKEIIEYLKMLETQIN